MKQESAKNFEIYLNTSSANFVKVISDNLAGTEVVIYPTEFMFMGKIDQSTFKLYRLKRFSWFDYNATEFKGTIHNDGQATKLTVHFSLIWIYKYTIALMLILFGFIDFFVMSADNATWMTTGTFLFVELLVLGQIWLRNKAKFKKDKERYFKILKLLFGAVEIRNGPTHGTL